MTSNDYHLISPISFANAMKAHWVQKLGNVSSPALEELWISMASAFGKAVIDFDQGVHTWQVLQLPTGTGKTQGACVYCALTSRENTIGTRKLGVLFVTRLIAEADSLVSQINQLAERECAVANHSQAKASAEDMRRADILVITHAAYVKALEKRIGNERGRLPDYIEWDFGKRRLTIIDESLGEIIDNYQVKAEDVRYALGFISPDIRRDNQWAVAAVEEVHSVLNKIADIVDQQAQPPSFADDPLGAFDAGKDDGHTRIVWRSVNDGKTQFPDNMGINDLRSAMFGLPYDQMSLKRSSAFDRERIANRIDATLKGIEAILSRWAFYAKKGKDHTLNAAQLLLPSDLPGPVVLDATARQNFLWELLGERAFIYPTPPKVRSYVNVKLHVAYGFGIGKTKMLQRANERVPKLLASMEHSLVHSKRVLLCVHKGIEHLVLNYETDFTDLKVAHWGAIDGRNDWQDFDAVVIFGLPYRDAIWANSAFFALQGLPDNEWMAEPKWGSYDNVRQVMLVKQLTVSIIQAINRVRCRRVIDEAGNCPAADVFIVLPDNADGKALLANICEEMQDIEVADWDFQIDEPAEKKIRKGSSHEALVALMRNADAGEFSMNGIRKELDLEKDAYKALQKVLRDSEHQLTKTLEDLGVTYAAHGKGRSAKSFLMKR